MMFTATVQELELLILERSTQTGDTISQLGWLRQKNKGALYGKRDFDNIQRADAYTMGLVIILFCKRRSCDELRVACYAIIGGGDLQLRSASPTKYSGLDDTIHTAIYLPHDQRKLYVN